ncbi:hypothetical protein J1TS3_17050 [Siminovitchia fordii]|uniref:Uncharacterized protein n=1 Tax=Siminovitchia fordii TaxID=254759 RepID=A0ABQ4K6J3_9BACI|nr:hypothetical protein J1TS3_17050 [Siminovitchia fordii]
MLLCKKNQKPVILINLHYKAMLAINLILNKTEDILNGITPHKDKPLNSNTLYYSWKYIK